MTVLKDEWKFDRQKSQVGTCQTGGWHVERHFFGKISVCGVFWRGHQYKGVPLMVRYLRARKGGFLVLLNDTMELTAHLASFRKTLAAARMDMSPEIPAGGHAL